MKRLSQNTLLLLASNIGGAILLFALSALIGRALGSEGLGIYAVALAWVYPLSMLVEFGLTTLMTREIGASLERVPPYMDAITRMRLLMGGGILISLLLAAPLISADPRIVIGLQVSAPMVIIQPFYSQFTTVFKARGDMRLIPLLNIGMIGAQVGLTALVLFNGGSVIHALILNTVTSAGQLAAAWWLYRRHDAQRNEHREAAFTIHAPTLTTVSTAHTVSVRPMLKAALPFALAALFAAIQARLLFVLLENLTSAGDVGYFSAANRFAEAARLIPNALFGALFPMAVAAQPDHLRLTFRRATLGLAAFGVLAGLGFTLLAPFLLTLVFGHTFAPAIPALILLGWSLLFASLRGVRTIYCYAHGREGFVNRVSAGAIILLVLLSLWLIPAHHTSGAALALLLTELCAVGALYAARPA